MVYNARIIFLNTRGYFGVQYDVQAEANGKILNMNMQAHPNALGPFMGYTEDKYESFDDIQAVLDKQFADLKTQVPGFEGKLEGWLANQREDQRSAAALNAAGTTNSAGYLGPGALDISSAVIA